MNRVRIEISEANRADFGLRPMVATHSLADHELFSDDALADLLDTFPREHLYALTMGHDVTRPDQNRLALHDHLNGRELLRAVRNGRLWLNITRVDRVDSRYRALIDSLYEELTAKVPGFAPLSSQGTLLISSPRALVYYHADASTGALWHIRGHKRVWVYPALDRRFADREFLEDIFAGVRHEYLPYEPCFDRGAIHYDLSPGQWVTWPQNAPHRVTNLDTLNVSLSTEHSTAASMQRQRLYMANRFFRTRLGCSNLAARENGFRAEAKIFVHRAAYKLGLDRVRYRSHAPAMRVDADAPDGVVGLSPHEFAAAKTT